MTQILLDGEVVNKFGFRDFNSLFLFTGTYQVGDMARILKLLIFFDWMQINIDCELF